MVCECGEAFDETDCFGCAGEWDVEFDEGTDDWLCA